ncbi:hypothetical protein IHE45_08G009400 [Dioscorea alata]|uniref:Uncharacterized protein n=2 Tax=Dioscorea alata TaxID=55571 RepID=A0ACB7VHH8_DIOAL|nr:hypothetical protein IHE45_08G009400 [Dioscorea alata]
MGAKVQCKSYLPGYNPMRGQDDDRNVSWSLFCDGKARNGHAYNEVMLKTVLGYSECDKEMLKRTMLEHEAIFRKQVYELHRLYRTQKNLMDELKRKELYRFSLPKDLLCASQASSFLSQAPPGDNEKKLRPSHLSFGNVPLNFLNENQSSVQSCRSTVENGGLKDDEVSKSKSNRFPRRMLDLELPADVYIDNEMGFAATMQPGNDLKLTLGTGEDSGCRENSQKLDSRLKNCDLADLNEPAKECSDRAIGYAPTFIFGTRTGCEVIQENKLPLRTETAARSHQRDKDAECSSKELPLLGKDSGRSHYRLNSSGLPLYNEKAPIVSEAVELKLNQTNGSHSPLDSSLRKPTNKISHIPIAVQALPCFNKPSTMNLQFNHNSSNHTSFISDKPSRNSNHSSSAFGASEGHRSPKYFKSLHCIDVKSAKALNLNQACTNDIVDGFATEQDTSMKHEESSGGIPWLRKKPICERNAAQSYTQLLANCATTSSGFEGKPNNVKGLFTSSQQELQQTLEMNEASNSLSSKRILGFISAETIKQSDIQTRFLTDNVKCNEGAGIRFERSSGSKSSRNQINLNSSGSPRKIMLNIDLEAPVTCHADDQSAEIDYTFKADCLNKTENLHEQCIREAAESIFAISQDTFNNADKLTCHKTLVTESDALSWFADVVLSSDMEKELKWEDHLGSESLDDDGFDLFESMTLKLEEMKVEELQCHSQGQDDQEEERKGSVALLLLTKPRRGSTRKRRQKRDFQKDILPGLATLSRHEVIEDLKTIEGLARSAGAPWPEASPTKRKAQTRGRGRPRSLPAVEPVSEPKNAKPVDDDKSIVGWGRTTRRCRRPRCPPGSVGAPLV